MRSNNHRSFLCKKTMNIKSFIRSTHKWLALPLGIIISIICFSGAALIFRQEILELSNPDHYNINKTSIEGKEAIPLEELIPIINSQLKDNSVTSISINENPTRTYQVSLAEGFRVTAFVNQYTGEIKGYYAVSEHFFFQIMKLHRWLLGSNQSIGKNIVGWTTVAFIILIITGLSYLRKRKIHMLKVNFNKGKKRLLFDLHNALGWYAALVLIICSLTGLMWSFTPYRNAVFYIFGERKTEQPEQRGERGHSRGGKKDTSNYNTGNWQLATNEVFSKDIYDNIQVSNGTISAHPKNTYRGRVQDQYTFDLETGRLKDFKPFSEKDVTSKVWAWAYSLHVGDYWGIWSKIFTFIFCLIGGSLPLTGYYSWWSKRRKKKKQTIHS